MNIKIVICFIIISFFPAVTASAADNVWAARSSGFIGANDTFTFENYLIKAKPAGNEKASIIVYKNNNKIEQRDFNVNEFREYDNIRVTLLGIKGGYSWIAVSKPEIRDILIPSGSKLLKWGEKYRIEDYTITPEVFNSASVNLLISNSTMTETKVFSNNSFSDHGNLRIVVTNINRTGFVELDFLRYPAPNISAGIFTDKDEYNSDETIQASIDIAGDAAQNIAGIFLESGANAEIEPVMASSTNVTDLKTFRFRVTQLQPDSHLMLTATIKIRDYNFNEYSGKASKAIRVLPLISVIKRVPAETDEKNVTVELYIHNAGPTEETISVYDAVHEDETLNLKQLNWVVKLKPGSSAKISYYAIPQTIGRYVFPPAIVKWKNYSSKSGEVEMMVHGPSIVVTKSAEKNDCITRVKLDIYNSGDRPALVNLSDKVPDGYPVISGNTTWEDLLEGGESTAVMYSLQGNAGVLPAAQVTYRDIHGVYRQAQSNTVEMIDKKETIEKNDAGEENTGKDDTTSLNPEPMEMLAFMVSSFIAIAGIMSGAAMVAVLSIRSRRS